MLEIFQVEQGNILFGRPRAHHITKSGPGGFTASHKKKKKKERKKKKKRKEEKKTLKKKLFHLFYKFKF